MAPGLSGPATVEEKSLDTVSLDLWTGSEKKTVPCEAQCGAYRAGLEPYEETLALEACAVQGDEAGVKAESPCHWLRSESLWPGRSTL